MALELSIDDAKARLDEASSAAAAGERVVLTKEGRPYVQIVPVGQPNGVTLPKKPETEEEFWARLQAVRDKLGLKDVKDAWPEGFDDPAFSRAVLGLDDD